MKRYLIILGLCAIVIQANTIQAKQLFNKKTIQVEQEIQPQVKEIYGKTAIDESKIIDIVSRFDGYVTKLFVDKSYQYVSKGDKLFSLFSSDVLNIQKELVLANKINNNTIKQSAVKKLLYLDIDNKEIEKILLQNQEVENITFYAKQNGYVVTKNINQNSFVKNGELILQIADFGSLWVIAKVYQKDIEFIHKNMKAKVKIDGLSQGFNASVDFIYPNLNESDNTIDIRLILENKDLKIFPNMFAKIDLLTDKKTMLTLPRSAVITKGDKNYVFVPLNEGEYTPKEVTVHRIHNDKFEILSGLSVGDTVIDKALFMLDSDAITNNLYNTNEDDWEW